MGNTSSSRLEQSIILMCMEFLCMKETSPTQNTNRKERERRIQIQEREENSNLLMNLLALK
jgi:hypothetical protein